MSQEIFDSIILIVMRLDKDVGRTFLSHRPFYDMIFRMNWPKVLPDLWYPLRYAHW